MTDRFIGSTRAEPAFHAVAVLRWMLMVRRVSARARSLRTTSLRFLLAIALSCVMAMEGRAGEITTIGFRTTVGRGILTGGSVVTPFLNNGPTVNGLLGTNLPTFAHEELYGGPPSPFDVILSVKATIGVTTYQVSDQVFNFFLKAPTDWTGLLLQVGFGTGADFVQAGKLSQLNFSGPFTANRFSAADGSALTALTFSGPPGITAGNGDALGFLLNVPDLATEKNQFTLQVIPIVKAAGGGGGQGGGAAPEPPTLVLAGTSVVALALWSSWRHRRGRS
jgi:hypothetical protein